MHRTIVVMVAGFFIAGCSSTSHLLPGFPTNASSSQSRAAHHRGKVRVLVRIRIPHRNRKQHALHPSTISPLTQSVSIAVNGGAPAVFNTTPTSAGCTVGSSGTTCTFAIVAPPGTDTFSVETYTAPSAGGTALDLGVATVPIAAGKANQVAFALGPVVTTTADSGEGSLRYAIASANNGDAVLFLLPAGATITLSSKITILNTVTLAGPGANKLSISGGGAHQLFFVLGTLTISGLTVTGGQAVVTGQPGGAIENEGTLALASDVIGNNTSTVALRRAPHASRALRLPALRSLRLHPHCTTTFELGGAIYNTGALTITGTTFTNNIVPSDFAACRFGEGGAIYNDVTGAVSSTGDVYTSNSAYVGGAVYNASLGQAKFSGDTFTGNTGCTAASGCPTSGCGATFCTSTAEGQGGAIFDAGSGITVTNSTFNNNVVGGPTPGSSGLGGAIVLSSILPVISGSTFSGNLAGGGTSSCSVGYGGAVVTVTTAVMDNDTFSNNSAGGDLNGSGGAIYATAPLSGTGDTFTGNTAVASGGACTTSGAAVGGAITDLASATLTNSTFTNNSATGNFSGEGGAIGTFSAIVNGCSFTSNAALANGQFGATGATAIGGALDVQSTSRISGSTFTSNSATINGSTVTIAYGGAVGVPSGPVYSANNTYTSNAAVEKAGAASAVGGAIAALGSSIISSGDAFTSNSATGTGVAEGGAVLSQSGGQFSNATFSSNSASGQIAFGGGLLLGAGGTTTLRHVTISANSSTGPTAAGGGLVDESGAAFLNSTITQNTTTTVGGGIYAVTNAEAIFNSSVTGNTVSNASIVNSGGGGIFELSGLFLQYATVANNTVTVSAAGSSGGGGIINSGNLFLLNSTVSGNKVRGTVPGGGGGGILSNTGIDAVDSTISSNSSSMDGGGVMQTASAPVTFINATIYNNAATGNGGNIDNLQQMTLVNSVVGGGAAGSGNDVYNAPAATLTSGDYDIFGSAFAGGGTYTAGTGDLFANPNLVALANNGGPTFTNADQPSSPGRAYIPFSSPFCGIIAVTTDQRGYTRGAGGKCDAGAYEYAGVATAIQRRPVLPKHFFSHTKRRAPIEIPPLPKPAKITIPTER